MPVLAAVGQLIAERTAVPPSTFLRRMLVSAPVIGFAEHLRAVRLAPVVSTWPSGKTTFVIAIGLVAPAAVGERRVDDRHFQRRDAEREPAERFGRVAREVGGDAHLVGHLRDRFLAEVGGQLRVDGVVGFERRRDEVDRAVLLAAERFALRRSGTRQPARRQRVRVVVVVLGSIPRESASASTIALNVDPGWRWPRRRGCTATAE